MKFQQSWARIITVIGLTLATSIPSMHVTALAAAGTGTWASWTGSSGIGTVDLKSGGFTSPSADVTSDGNSFATPTGTSAWLNAGTPAGAQFGSSRNRGYLQVGTQSGNSSTTTLTFINRTPASGWGFVLGDIDADRVSISAVTESGTAVTNVNTWFRGTFNYCNGVSPSPCVPSTDVPTWDGISTLTGNGRDTNGASGWFMPNQSLKSLTFTFSGLVGFPVFQLWLAGDTAPTNRYTITYVARACDKYTDVMANQARNNLMETLKDVGVDTLYKSRGNIIRPEVEDDPATGQANCQPLSDWTFSTGIQTDGKDSGSFGSLSRVRAPNYHAVQTARSTAELDDFGNDTGRDVQGAITYTLTDAEVAQTTGGKRFWVQGGLRGQPLNGKENRYGFAGLRCATDNLNADNVEWVSFANSARHRFCYAYYVTPPPVKATIVVRKVLAGSSASVPFTFHGDISYESDNSFEVSSGASQTFIRAADYPWTISEDLPKAPYGFSSVQCISASGTSIITTDPATRTAVVSAKPDDVVTCTFTNKFSPKTKLDVYKVTQGATGIFNFTVNTESINNFGVTEPSTPVLVYSKNGLAGGSTATISEGSLPAAIGGAWGTPMLDCAAVDASGNALTAPNVSGDVLTTSTVTLSATDGSKNECTITNTFIPNAKVRVHSQITGGSGSIEATSSYVLTRSDGDPLTASAESSIQHTVVNDNWDSYREGNESAGLSFGDYTLTGYSPADAESHTWTLTDVHCSGASQVSIEGGQVNFTLNDAEITAPEIDCYFTYKIAHLVNLTLTKESIGAIGDFTLTASYLDNTVSGIAHVTVEQIQTTATVLNNMPEGTEVTLDETNLPTTPAGQWNQHTGGRPTWICTDGNGDTVPIQASLVITLPATSVTCSAKNVFIPSDPKDPVDPVLPEAGDT